MEEIVLQEQNVIVLCLRRIIILLSEWRTLHLLTSSSEILSHGNTRQEELECMSLQKVCIHYDLKQQ
jgi:hypothetical protein